MNAIHARYARMLANRTPGHEALRAHLWRRHPEVQRTLILVTADALIWDRYHSTIRNPRATERVSA